MEFTSENNISLKKELSDLDKFTFDFVKILRKYTNYVVISGYVSILLGRSRSSEDVDIIIPKMNNEIFNELWSDLIKNDFYCLNGGNKENMLNYLSNGTAIRFAKKGDVIPNIELKFSKSQIDNIALNDKIKVLIDNEAIFISNLELQIAFKEKILKSSKDIEDAKHLRDVAGSNLDISKLNQYGEMLHEFC